MTAVPKPIQLANRAPDVVPDRQRTVQSFPLRAEIIAECRADAPYRAPVDRGPTAQARESLSRVITVPVERLPPRSAMQAGLGILALTRVAESFGCPIALADSRRRLAAMMTGMPADSWPGVAELVQRGNTLDSDVHDAFFHISRLEDQPELRHLATILDAAAALQAELQDGATMLDDATLARVAQGIEECFALSTGIRPVPLALPPRRRGLIDDAIDAARRWLRGHHIFLVITQGLVVALEDLVATHAQSASSAPPPALIAAMGSFAALIDMSADAICLTGDFAPDIYDRVIRVAMAPPYMPEGFSGVFSSDHRHLVRRLREERPMFEALRDGVPGAHADVVASMIRLYDNHKQVCGHFIGVDRGSLLMAPRVGQTAVDQLEKFKQSRLRNLGVTPPRP